MVTRRGAAAAIGAGVLCGALGTAGATQLPARTATYVLVHGASAGGWIWKPMLPHLRAAGHRVFTPTLTGGGERRHLLRPETDLETHIDDVLALLRWENLAEVILVGHSYGGMVITGVADRARERIGHLVYLDAAHPRNGQSLEDVAPAIVAYGKQTLRTVKGAEVIVAPDFEMRDAASPLPPYGETPAAREAWKNARLTPFPWKAVTGKLRLRDEEGVLRIPRTKINTSSSLQMAGKADAARQMDAERAWTVDTTHDLMVTEPKITAEMLLRLASL